MSNAYTGGPAFPVSTDILSLPEPAAVMGMTLRDYFAAKAMQSIFALGESYDYGGNPPIDELPRHAYALADAMLRERAK